MSEKQKSDFFREYSLIAAHKQLSTKTPAVHQKKALKELDKWFKSNLLSPMPEVFSFIKGGGDAQPS